MGMPLRAPFVLTPALILFGCVGAISSPPERDPIAPVESTVCDPSAAPEVGLLRIDRQTYVSGLEAVFGSEVMTAIEAELQGLPTTQNGVYSSELDTPSFALISAYSDVAAALAFELADHPEQLGEAHACLIGLEVEDPATDACLGGLVDDLAPQILRRPLQSADRARFLEAYADGAAGGTAEGVASVLMTLLLDPRFLYFVEIDGEETSDGHLRLTSHELAARLARTIWRSIPDDELRAAADAGLEGERLQEQVARMWEDPRARAGFADFFGDWLELNDGVERDESLRFVEHIAFDRTAGLEAMFLDRTAFIEDEAMALRYGLDASARGEVELPEDERAGILTRAGWLQTLEVPGSNAGHVIHRGVSLARLVCRPVPDPDPNLFPDEDPAEASGAETSIRERFAEVTQDEPCASCHQYIDGFGAPFGHYGSLGEWIDVEVNEGSDGGHFETAIDTNASLLIAGGEQQPVGDALELSEALAGSDEVAQCFAEQLVQNSFGRPVDRFDGCATDAALEVLRRPDADEGSIRDAVVALFASTAFTERAYPEGGE